MVGMKNYALFQVFADDLRLKWNVFRCQFDGLRILFLSSGDWTSFLLESMFAVQSKLARPPPSRSLG